MANYLDYLYQRQGIQPGLLGNAYNMAAQMLQNGSANTQALMQANDRIKAQQAQDEAAASRGLQQAAQRQAEDEARKKQGLMTIASLAFGGGGGEAATGGAGQAATEKMAEEAAEKAMAQIAPGEYLKNQIANPESFLYDPLKAYQNGGAFFTPKSGLLWG